MLQSAEFAAQRLKPNGRTRYLPGLPNGAAHDLQRGALCSRCMNRRSRRTFGSVPSKKLRQNSSTVCLAIRPILAPGAGLALWDRRAPDRARSRSRPRWRLRCATSRRAAPVGSRLLLGPGLLGGGLLARDRRCGPHGLDGQDARLVRGEGHAEALAPELAGGAHLLPAGADVHEADQGVVWLRDLERLGEADAPEPLAAVAPG